MSGMRASLFEPFTAIDLPLDDRRDGKVRASWACGDLQRLLVTTDRLSAFDRVLAGVPYKGQVLNELSAWWFQSTADVIANHVIPRQHPHPRSGGEQHLGLRLFRNGVAAARQL